MQRFYVNPTTYNSPPLAEGFGDQGKPDTKPDDKAEDKTNIALESDLYGDKLAPG